MLVVATTVLAALGLLAGGVAAAVADNLLVPVTWTADQEPATADRTLQVGGPTTSTLTIGDPSGLQRLWVFAPAMVLCIVVIAGGVLLHRVLRSVESGDLFHPANARRVAAMGTVAAVGGATGAAITTAGRILFLSSAELGHDGPAADVASFANASELPATALAVAATLWAVAAVLRRGAALRSDLQGLV